MIGDDEVQEIELRLILEAIYARYGYDLRDYARASMRRRLIAAMQRTGAKHLGELQHRLLTEPDLFVSVLDDLTVQVTEMFRDPAFYRSFRATVVPHLRTYPQIKVWHAGCATGEEVYATAIVLAEEDLYDRTQIYATDLSVRALERAREGVYPAGQAVAFAANHQQAGGKEPFDKYCSQAYDRISIKDTLRRNVVFFQHDLVSDHVLGEMQVIFCRNVLIYFSRPLQQRVLVKLAQGLSRGGFLCLGSSERIPENGDGGQFVAHDPQARIYRCRGAA